MISLYSFMKIVDFKLDTIRFIFYEDFNDSGYTIFDLMDYIHDVLEERGVDTNKINVSLIFTFLTSVAGFDVIKFGNYIDDYTPCILLSFTTDFGDVENIDEFAEIFFDFYKL